MFKKLFWKESIDAPYYNIKSLQSLKEPMEKREEGRTKYYDLVFNKMKPKWLFAQVASHPLARYWFFWIDENITSAIS